MPSARSGTADAGAKTRRWPLLSPRDRTVPDPRSGFGCLSRHLHRRLSFPGRSRRADRRLRDHRPRWPPRRPSSPGYLLLLFERERPAACAGDGRTRQPLCRLSRPLNSAGKQGRDDHEFRLMMLRLLACGALLIAARLASARREGTFDIPRGRAFQPAKARTRRRLSARRDRAGKIPGAIVLIQQHGKPVYHEHFGVRTSSTRRR